MSIKVGINGFGRIGKSIFKILVKEGIEVSVINDPFVDINYLKYLIDHDSVYNNTTCIDSCNAEGNSNNTTCTCIKIKDKSIIYPAWHNNSNLLKTELLNIFEPENINWRDYGVDLVIESTGKFIDMESLNKHNVDKVIVTAPSKDVKMYVYGVNHKELDKSNKLFSAASCTTNCLAPIAKVINDNFGIKEAFMTTVHSLTASQSTVDSKGKKWRSSRSAFNIIPATTGAAEAVSKVIPSLENKLTGMAFRVPIENGSVVDFVVSTEKETSLEKISKIIKNSNSKIITSVNEDIVSSDIIGNSHSSIFDLKASMQLNNKFFKLICWYDNEYGYSCRVVDLVKYIYE